MEEAAPLFREALNGRRRILGDDHPNTLTSINNMAVLLEAQGKLKEAAPLHREVVDRSLRTLGDDHPRRSLYQSNWDRFQSKQEELRREESGLN